MHGSELLCATHLIFPREDNLYLLSKISRIGASLKVIPKNTVHVRECAGENKIGRWDSMS